MVSFLHPSNNLIFLRDPALKVILRIAAENLPYLPDASDDEDDVAGLPDNTPATSLTV